jgi:hypothetical protein
LVSDRLSGRLAGHIHELVAHPAAEDPERIGMPCEERGGLAVDAPVHDLPRVPPDPSDLQGVRFRERLTLESPLEDNLEIAIVADRHDRLTGLRKSFDVYLLRFCR